jgi:hypothetical protein
MLRWMILLGTLALWAGSMFAVYQHTRPAPVQETVRGGLEGFEALFEDDAETQRYWKIYADFSRVQKPDEQKQPITWNGRNEAGLVEVGTINTELKRKSDSQVEQQTDLQFRIPTEARMAILEPLGLITARIGCTYSFETGLDMVSVKANTALGLRIDVFGIRDVNSLRMTQTVFQGQTKFMENRHSIDLGAAPSADLTPFVRHRNIGVGKEWEFARVDYLDPKMMDPSSGGKVRVITMKAYCTKRTEIEIDKVIVPVFEVKTEDGLARAWYSADGSVLKQIFRIGDSVDIMLVRTTPRKRTERKR